KPSRSLEDLERAVHPPDRARFRNDLAAALRTDDLTFESRVVWPDGGVHWLAMTGRAVRDSSQFPPHVLGVVAEVTDRKRVEQADAELLREQAARAEAEAGKKRIAEILERIDMAFVALDHAGRFTY